MTGRFWQCLIVRMLVNIYRYHMVVDMCNVNVGYILRYWCQSVWSIIYGPNLKLFHVIALYQRTLDVTREFPLILIIYIFFKQNVFFKENTVKSKFRSDIICNGAIWGCNMFTKCKKVTRVILKYIHICSLYRIVVFLLVAEVSKASYIIH